MNYSQMASIIGAILAVAIGGIGIWQGWFDAPNGLALISAGLAILGVHTGGSVAGSIRAEQ